MHHRKRLRLKDFNYSRDACYFVTICTHERVHHFGEIVGEEMKLNGIGYIANEMWKGLTKVFKEIVLDEHIVMPNHVHGIIGIIDPVVVDAKNKHVVDATKREMRNTEFSESRKNILSEAVVDKLRPVQDKIIDKTKMLIPKIVQAYKAEVSRRVKKKFPEYKNVQLWQRSFYDRIIRSKKEFDNIAEYIADNPLRWAMDVENKINARKSTERYYGNIISAISN